MDHRTRSLPKAHYSTALTTKDSEPQRGWSLAAFSYLGGERSRGQRINPVLTAIHQDSRIQKHLGCQDPESMGDRSALHIPQSLWAQAKLQFGVGQPHSSALLGTMLCQSCSRGNSFSIAPFSFWQRWGCPRPWARTHTISQPRLQQLRVTKTNRFEAASWRGAGERACLPSK